MPGVFRGMRDAKVHHVNAILRVQHDVLRLQIAVEPQPAGVCGFERTANLGDDPYRLLGWKFSSVPEHGTKIPAFHELHGDEFEALGLSQIENADDIPVSNFASQDQFRLKRRRISDCWRGQHGSALRANSRPSSCVARLINGAHSALTE